MKKTFKIKEIIRGIIAILLMAVIAWFIADRTDKGMREALLQDTSIGSKAINVDRAKNLTGTVADVHSPDYLRLKEQFASMRTVNRNLRFVYLMGLNNKGQLFFFVDDAPIGDPDGQPGQIYDDAPVGFYRVIKTGIGSVEGPFTDKWGSYISGCVPVIDPESGKTIAIFAIDFNARSWYREIATHSALPLGLLLLLYLGAIAFLGMRNKGRQLRENEQSYRNQFVHNSAVMLLIDPIDGAIIDANNSALGFYGYTREQLLTMNISDINPMPVTELRQKMASISQEHGRQFKFEHRLADGSLRDVEVSLSRIFFSKRNLLHSIIQDITERKNAEAALISSVSLLDASLESTTDGILIVNSHRKITKWNQKFAKLWQLPEEIIASKDDAFLINHILAQLSDPELFTSQIAYLYEHPDESSNDLIQFLDGRIFERYSQAQIIGKEIAGRVWSFRDITERKQAEEDLRKSEEQLKAIFENSLNPILIADDAGNYYKVNKAAAKMFGYPVGKMLQMNISDLQTTSSPDAAKRYQEYLAKGYEIGEFDFVRPDKSRVIAHYHAVRVRENFNLSILSDITGLKQAEEALRESEGKLRSIYSVAPTGIGVMENGILKEANPYFFDMLGYTRDELLERDARMLYPSQEEYEFVGWGKYNQIREKGTGKVETLWQKKDGSIVNILLASTPIDKNDFSKGIIFTALDITERKLSEVALHESEERFNLAMKASNDGLFDWNLETNAIYYSPGWKKMLGYTNDELPNDFSVWEKTTDPEDVKKSWELQQKLIAKQIDRFVMEFKMKHKDGHWVDIMAKAEAIFNEHGKAIRMVGTHTDITLRKQAEKQLRESEEKFKSLMQQSPFVVELYDINGLQITVNKAYEELWGFPAETTLNKFNVLESKEVEETGLLEYVKRAYAGNYVDVPEYIFDPTGDTEAKGVGRRRWLNTRIYPLKDESGKVKNIVIVHQDITDRKQAEEALRISKEQFELAVSGTNDGIWDWNLLTNELFLSKRWKSMLGYKDEELKNEFSTFASLVFEDDLERVNKYVQGYLAGEIKEYFLEFRMKHKDGHPRWILAKGEAIRDENGIPFRMAGSHSDITERKNIEFELQENKQRLELAIDAGEHGFWDWDLMTNITYFSPKYYTMLGYVDRELPMHLETFSRLIHPEDESTIMPVIQKSLKDGKPYSVEFRLLRKEGAYFWINGKGKVYQDDTGKPLRAVGVHIDINERKTSEQKLQESELRFSVAIEGTEAGIWDWDMVKNEVTFSFQWKAMLGYEDAEIENSFAGWKNLWHPDDVAAIEKSVTDHLSSLTEKYEIIHRCRHKDGSWHWIMTRGKILRDPAGTPYRWIGTNIDITAQKQAEEELKIAKEQAEAASKAKSEFLANMSHEIRTPLNGVIGFTDLLRNTPLNKLQQQYVDNANVSGHTLLGIINDILDFSKIEAGMLELEAIKTDMVELLENSIDIVKFPAGKKDIEILLDIDPAMPQFALVDPIRLKQILANLLGNAVKFTKKGEVELKVGYVALDGGQGKLSFAVRDTGIGISDAQKEKLFKAFSQADSSTTRNFGGTGLGLIISEMIAGKMGSKINISSTPGVGTTFYFAITTTVEDGQKLDSSQIAQVKRCLIIDDNANNRLILEQMLQQWQIECNSCDNGLEALKRLETSRPFDVIICDYNMPYIDGLETIRMMREKLKLSPDKQPVILLHSSSENAEMHRKCEEMGVRFRLNKPVKSKDLFNYLCNLHQTEKEIIKQEEPEQVPDSSSTDHTGKKIKIMVAEDVPMNMMLIKVILSHLVGDVEIVEAKNGLLAIEIYKANPLDLVLMDVQMPECDGLEATKKIREIEAVTGKHVPIIALTAGALKEEMEKCFAAGMDDFLTKPIESEKTKAVLNKHLACRKKAAVVVPNVDANSEVHFGYTELVQNLCNDMEFIRKIITAAMTDIPVKIKQLEQACYEMDFTKINAAAHSIKGACLSMRFNPMAAIAVKLEQDAKDNRLENLEEFLSELNDEWEIIKNILLKME